MISFEHRLSKCETFLFGVLISTFKIVGLAPFTISTLINQRNNRKQISLQLSYSRSGFLYNVILSLLLMVSMAYMINFLQNELRNGSEKVSTIYSIAITVSGSIFLCYMILYYAIKQENILKHLNNLLNLDKELTKTLGMYYQVNYKKFIIIAFIVYFIINVIIIVVLIFSYQIHLQFILRGVGFTIGNIILQYVVIFNFIQEIYRNMNNSLLSLSRIREGKNINNIFLINTFNDDSLFQRLIFIRKIQRDVTEILHNFSKFFSWPLLLCISFICTCTVFNVFMCLKPFILSKEELQIYTVDYFLRITKDIYLMVMLTSCVTNLITEMKRTSKIVYKLIAAFPSQIAIRLELEQFSIELLHRKAMPFTACGLFSLDASLLTSVARIILTYMVLLIQCQLYEQKSTKWSNPNETSTRPVQIY